VFRLETGVPGVDVVDGFAQGFGGGQGVGSPSMRHRKEYSSAYLNAACSLSAAPA
jgi:hypothetical protein